MGLQYFGILATSFDSQGKMFGLEVNYIQVIAKKYDLSLTWRRRLHKNFGLSQVDMVVS